MAYHLMLFEPVKMIQKSSLRSPPKHMSTWLFAIWKWYCNGGLWCGLVITIHHSAVITLPDPHAHTQFPTLSQQLFLCLYPSPASLPSSSHFPQYPAPASLRPNCYFLQFNNPTPSSCSCAPSVTTSCSAAPQFLPP